MTRVMTTCKGETKMLGLQETDSEYQHQEQILSESRKRQLPLSDAYDEGCRSQIRELVTFAHKLACKQVERSEATTRNPHANEYHRWRHEHDVRVRDGLAHFARR